MADIPASGDENWGVDLNAYQAVGHDTNGTHKKSQMLTDMEWSPTAYLGEESITFPNNLVMKHGTIANGGATTDVSFATAFDTALTSVSVTGRRDTGTSSTPVTKTETVTGFTITSDVNTPNFYWQAWGY